MRSISNTPDAIEYQKKWTTIDRENFEPVIEGMFNVVERTARIARIKGIDVCGKTGTVEKFIQLNGEKTQLTDHSIFIAFALKEDPKIAWQFLLKMVARVPAGQHPLPV